MWIKEKQWNLKTSSEVVEFLPPYSTNDMRGLDLSIADS